MLRYPIPTPELVWRSFKRYKAAFTIGGVLLVGTTLFGLTIPWLLKLTVDALQHVDQTGNAPVAQYALLIAGAALAQMGIRILSRLVIFGAGRDIENDLRNELLEHLETLPPSYYAGQSTGDIISRASNDISNIRLLFGPAFLNIVNTSVTLLTALIMMLLIDPQLTALALLPVPIVYFAIRRIAGSLAKQFLDVQVFLGKFSGQIQEMLAGVLVVKAFARETWAEHTFGEINAENFTRNMALARSRGLMLPMMGAIGGLGTFLILLFGGQAVIAGRISLGDFVAFNGYMGMLVWPLLALGWVYAMLQRGLAAAQRIDEILCMPASIASVAQPIPLPPGGGEVRFENVTSVYPVKGETPRPAIRDLTLQIAAGSFIGITGPVGSGKSTLLRTLLRLQEVSQGNILVDGVNLFEVALPDVRRAIAYVPQEAFLFSTTVRENIAFGHPGITDFEIERAADMARLTQDIAQLPKGFDTIVGERGVMLSGWQRQRVALARALVRDPRLLLLDDALSAVDSETEDSILANLSVFMRNRTSIVATHRLAGIRRADFIFVLDHGILVESGTHDALLAHDGLYNKLWVRQQLHEQLESF